MSRLYLYLSVAGWAWLVLLVGYVSWRSRGGRGLSVNDGSKDEH